MNENKKSFLSFIFIILSLILSYLGFSNLRYMESSYFNLTRENSSLIEKRNKTQENIKNLSQEINLKNSKLDVITREIEKFDVLQNKSTEIEDLNKELGDSLIPFQNDREFKFFEISKDKINSFTPLRGNFIDKNLNREDMEDNLRLMPFFVDSHYTYDLNRSIGKHNIKGFENLGLVEYLLKGDNYLLKSILLNDSSKMTKLKDEKEKILEKENNLLEVSENIYGLNKNSKNKNLNASKDVKDKEEDEEDILNALCLDILNSSINYLRGYEIKNEDGLNKFKSKDKILMTEKIEDKKLITNYYRGVDEKAYTLSEEKE
ncbi:hypothetical protein [Peptoniphilus sp. DNF00840]|uniref:hypothetical protein n=1 Tax=Peptoniphilus sp. DNF00840 TaxID=1477000 RepID=UPI00078196DF|nr:hypothetical protein [Peptoniphilus sp. DNF00840]KXB71827.1 hypothetical protein HMPREF1864_00362 [Peptoniphilus sp. DNF00840]